ncbi:Acetyl-CoA decarbonylase/synthase complex subunit gamma [Bienertia sinuspersici]
MYMDSDLVELRKSLNVEVDQLRSEFQDLRTTLQQQQEDVTVSLRNLGLQDPPKDTGTFTGHGVNDKVDNAEENGSGRSNEETTVDESSAKANGIEVHSSTAVEVDN